MIHTNFDEFFHPSIFHLLYILFTYYEPTFFFIIRSFCHHTVKKLYVRKFQCLNLWKSLLTNQN